MTLIRKEGIWPQQGAVCGELSLQGLVLGPVGATCFYVYAQTAKSQGSRQFWQVLSGAGVGADAVGICRGPRTLSLETRRVQGF
jgi:hypothetical protein